jgi:hypothetical protein
MEESYTLIYTTRKLGRPEDRDIARKQKGGKSNE